MPKQFDQPVLTSQRILNIPDIEEGDLRVMFSSVLAIDCEFYDLDEESNKEIFNISILTKTKTQLERKITRKVADEIHQILRNNLDFHLYSTTLGFIAARVENIESISISPSDEFEMCIHVQGTDVNYFNGILNRNVFI